MALFFIQTLNRKLERLPIKSRRPGLTGNQVNVKFFYIFVRYKLLSQVTEHISFWFLLSILKVWLLLKMSTKTGNLRLVSLLTMKMLNISRVRWITNTRLSFRILYLLMTVVLSKSITHSASPCRCRQNFPTTCWLKKSARNSVFHLP